MQANKGYHCAAHEGCHSLATSADILTCVALTKDQNFLSGNHKSHITSICCPHFSPTQDSRISIETIKAHPWFKKPLPAKYTQALATLSKAQAAINEACVQAQGQSGERDKALEVCVCVCVLFHSVPLLILVQMTGDGDAFDLSLLNPAVRCVRQTYDLLD